MPGAAMAKQYISKAAVTMENKAINCKREESIFSFLQLQWNSIGYQLANEQVAVHIELRWTLIQSEFFIIGVWYHLGFNDFSDLVDLDRCDCKLFDDLSNDLQFQFNSLKRYTFKSITNRVVIWE